MAAQAPPRPSLAVRERTLPNGLRVVSSPDPRAPAVALGIAYDVGFRSERPGRAGFAHLFEHLMFQGSENVPRLEFDRLLAASGGDNNGWTRSDFTFYFDIGPPNILELMLFLEADRMRALDLTEEGLRNQVAVVKEEVLTNVKNRPYGGFPWLDFPQIAFRTFANAHNFYGDFRDLDAATLAEAAVFYRRYYAPGNAVLSVAGAFDPRRLDRLVDRHFGDVAARRVPRRPALDEPPPRRERRRLRRDPLAPEPAVAVAWRTPDPQRERTDYLAAVLASEVLAEGEGSRLHQRLVKRDRCATFVEGDIDLETRAPALLGITAHYARRPGPERVLAAMQDEVDRLGADGPASDELERFRASWISSYLRALDELGNRVYYLSVFGLLYGRPRLVNEIAGEIAGITPERVRDVVARTMGPSSRAIVDLRPGKAARRG